MHPEQIRRQCRSRTFNLVHFRLLLTYYSVWSSYRTKITKAYLISCHPNSAMSSEACGGTFSRLEYLGAK
jgi:hypothetical protein